MLTAGSSSCPAGPVPDGNRLRLGLHDPHRILFFTDFVDHYSQIANYMRIPGMLPPSALPDRE